jgi:2-keto-3-deoxy-L-fuconate dehydrogenase
MLQVLESHGFIARELHGEGQAAEAARKAFIARRPMGRLGSAAEVAAAGLYLASDESGFMTGHALVIEGGFSL